MTRLCLIAAAMVLAGGAAHAQLYQTIETPGGGSYTIGPNGYLANSMPLAGGGGYSTIVTPEQPPVMPPAFQPFQSLPTLPTLPQLGNGD